MRRFPRGTIFHEEGNDAAEVVTARVISANYVTYTVSVLTQFDQKRYFDVSVGSPYLHPANGEGIYVMPEVGAWCKICIPSDTTPPFVQCFIMPSQVVDTSGPGAPSGPQSKGAVTEFANNASFAGNRPKAKGGDIIMRGRDENFVILHRGGVLQFGTTPLCQSLYIPLGNILRDVSQRYEHLNIGGSIAWGIQDGAAANPPVQYQHVFRVLANDEFADIRVAIGTVLSPIPEPPTGDTSELTQLQIGTNPKDPIIYELSFTPGGFKDTGDVQAAAIPTNKLRVFFDRAGGTFCRTEGNLLVSAKKKFRLRIGSDFEVQAGGNISFQAGGDVTFQGGGSLGVTAGVVKLNGGGSPIARQGDIVQVTFPFTPVVAAPAPLVVSGVILSGNNTVLG